MRSTTLDSGRCTVMRWLVGLVFLAWAGTGSTQAAGTNPGYVGSQICASCHAAETKAWQGSHHALAWTLPGPDTVLGDFKDVVFEHRGITTAFSMRDGDYWIETKEDDGTTQEYKVVGVAGIAPLQQYLVETEPGRIQALDVAWDADRGRWYHLYPDQHLRPGDGLHWTGPYKNWNARCAQCHATGYDKNYDPRLRRYASTQEETGVGCESCHGPGEAHVAWSKLNSNDDKGKVDSLADKGFTLAFTPASSQSEIEQCAGCHARREQLTDASPLPGTPFHDAYRLALLRRGLYHADGAIQDEVYVFGSFLQSKMYAKGVRCTDCHDPHTASLKADDNTVCTQCHSPVGNPRFSTLPLKDYDTPEHHFHETGTAGSQCKSCHMIERVYMGIDGRRDHSFRIPRPDLAAETDAPNACIDCHSDRTPGWAVAEIAKRHPDSAMGSPHFADAIAFARLDPANAVPDLLTLAQNHEQPGIVRATALDLLSQVADPDVATKTASLIQADDPLVRASAIAVQRGASPADRVKRLGPAIEDPTMSVRIAAARALIDVPAAGLPRPMATALQKAMFEWRESMLAKTDFPEAQMVLGGTALVLRNIQAAEAAFREAVRLDPQLVQAWIMIARIRAAIGDAEGVRRTLDDALRANPSDARLAQLRSDLEESSKP